MADKYILKGKHPVPCSDLIEWAEWLEKAERTVARNDIDGVTVSTVFLGLDHSFGDSDPLIFETMVFGGKYDNECERYSTWEQAEAGHKNMLSRVSANEKP